MTNYEKSSKLNLKQYRLVEHTRKLGLNLKPYRSV